ncbi:MAG TPA: hypothetical protein VFH13_00425, partial [Gemmatimonadaceae bacterium]|nr:hypothetical protein [Gemmatimonadaceae bacterium]
LLGFCFCYLSVEIGSRLKHEAVPKMNTGPGERNRTSARNDPFNPLDPYETSVSVAGRSETGDIVQVAVKASHHPSRHDI